AATARRIVWGKFTNAGQTCVAPDYLMAERSTLDALVPHLKDAVASMYGRTPQRSRDYGRMVNQKHFDRVLALIDDDKAVIGGTSAADRANRYLPPTILDGVDWDDPVMGEEIFGPVLPLLAVDGPDEAISRINGGEKPLTAYVFSPRPEIEARFIAETSSGSLALGHTLAHLGSQTMPFGGVGESGMGKNHGRASLEVFTHAKPVVKKPLRPDTLRLVTPPYRGAKRALLGQMFRCMPVETHQSRVNRPGFVRGSQVPRRRSPARSGGDGRCLRARRADHADLAVESLGVEPVDVLRGRGLGAVDARPGPAVANQF